MAAGRAVRLLRPLGASTVTHNKACQSTEPPQHHASDNDKNNDKTTTANTTLQQVYSADEVFVTGTFAGLIPVVEVDGRVIASGRRGPLTARLQQLYVTLMNDHAAEHARQQ